MCPFYAVLVRWIYVRHLFCPVRVRFSYVAYPVRVRYAFVTCLFYSVSTSTDSPRISILSTDNFYFHPLGVRSCYPVRCDRGLSNTDFIKYIYHIYLKSYFDSLTVWANICWCPMRDTLYMHGMFILIARTVTFQLQYNIFWQRYLHTYPERKK